MPIQALKRQLLKKFFQNASNLSTTIGNSTHWILGLILSALLESSALFKLPTESKCGYIKKSLHPPHLPAAYDPDCAPASYEKFWYFDSPIPKKDKSFLASESPHKT
ncbi:hypothetical protein SERLA73DRAFT_155897 [Serpula lacrymans var. lacrymans S7.3]|uniref:Uncharacterized protein n=1 Tax=Serpula lacrymans var. lacrymans (strain S7.3) TaxID=936435 RepID=F8QC22_SERL3|nr:hypothetical protein SERLA73DRAFT_155897 [Serpula lacrymans var. lacrymans S7.3]